MPRARFLEMSNMKLVILLLLTIAVVAGCASAPIEPLVRIVETALADGVVTAAEQAQIEAALPARFDWSELLVAGGSIVASILGVKVLPGSILRGPWDSPKQPPQPVA